MDVDCGRLMLGSKLAFGRGKRFSAGFLAMTVWPGGSNSGSHEESAHCCSFLKTDDSNSEGDNHSWWWREASGGSGDVVELGEELLSHMYGRLPMVLCKISIHGSGAWVLTGE